MKLQHISIVNYKNLKAVDVDLSPKINCLIGNNGMGKTNFVDAIYFLSFCRSVNNPVDSQLIRHEEPFFVLDGTFVSDDDMTIEQIYCGLKRGAKKQFKRNKKAYKRLAQHIGLIPTVMVSPADSLLIDGGSEERRRFMDMVISQYDAPYMEALIKYNKAVQQRNALLKIEEPQPDDTLMSLWEEEMSTHGSVIFEKRTAFVCEFVPLFQAIYKEVSGDSEQVELQYVSHGQRGDLLEVIRKDRWKDQAVGYSLHGIHRDDLELLLEGFSMKKEGSQGQRKTFVMAMKLAQFEFLKRTISRTTPLLLLDDIFDKLDAERVERIVKLVSSDRYGQIFITDTNRQHLDKILKNGSFDYRLYVVEEGNLISVES